MLLVLVLSASCLLTVKPVSAVPAENTWVPKAPMPSTLAYSKATVLNGKIYVIGARSGEYVNNSLLEYDPVANNWTERKSLLSSRRYFAVTTCQNKIYVIGGSLRDSSSLKGVSTNEVYDPLTDTWEVRASMPTARWDLVAETVNGKIYVISGRTGAGLTSVNVTGL